MRQHLVKSDSEGTHGGDSMESPYLLETLRICKKGCPTKVERSLLAGFKYYIIHPRCVRVVTWREKKKPFCEVHICVLMTESIEI